MAGTEINETGFNVAVVGATGAVGREMLDILEERDFPVRTLRAMASKRSAGKTVEFRGKEVVIEDLEEASFEGVDFGLFSAGGSVSKKHAPRAVDAGVVVIDNTSAFRMDPDVPLVVPEVNPEAIVDGPGIIANPNCSTIQMVVALKPLHDAAGLERIIVSTYQSASGAGQKGIDELMASVKARVEGTDEPEAQKFAHPLAFEALPHIDVFFDSGFTREELKMVNETRKIMTLPELEVAATCVRVPSVRSHSESVTVDLDGELSVEKARELWEAAPGVKVYDDPANNVYPLARLAEKTDDTWVGRIRQDLDRPQTLHFWVVSDNLRKGAALNAVQIAEELVRRRSET
ncbi:aspartate-semialdehyde dehydrogenase [Persicimonas caeni]|uniref:Aspartate-semialdehyde dehydrogenase n=1 Tax=Persicimonas caeni TaxID=2292766 RepID=A0A4Y6PW41_PERCE|nr:aspartate-semialdehyde dehydrogenase [Persicimonas caeni]QDG51955.1 aspartate-semialdehyde dehydrogenase [Persicimonas caeni]QED33176.1 aspartate-semialdehyde dehydrogenase [Persicimonas caeni]